MELSLKTEGIKCARLIWQGTVTREELSEHIVPDSCPDVSQILDVECQPFLTRCEPAEGRLDVSANVICQVLFLPEDESSLIPVRVSFPVQFMEERPDVTGKCVVHANVRASRGEVRMLNPRKMLLRVELIFEVKVFRRQEQQFCSQLPGQEGQFLQQQILSTGGRFLTAVPVKPFSFSDRLSFPGSRPAAVRILKQRGQVEVTEGRVVGSKVVLKGNVRLILLCQGECGEIFPVEFELPFSQIMDGEGGEEGADVEADIQLTEMSCTLADGGRSVETDLELIASAIVSQDKTLDLVTDAYSPLYPTELQCEDNTFLSLNDSGTRRQSVRTNAETSGEWETLSDLWASVGLVAHTREGALCRITTDIHLSALGRMEDGRCCSAEKTIPVVMELDIPEGCQVRYRWELTELHGEISSGGLDVKFTLIYQYKILSEKRIPVVSGVNLDQEHPYDLSEKPSLVLCRMEKQSTLWDLARKHLTTREAIQQVNGIEEEEPETGRFILIPKFR